MEGYARHSRSHFKSAPQPPPSAAAYFKKGFANGAGGANGNGNGFMAYDDVFGGPPKFGATPFAPRAEDYSEIFGGFRSSRSSSIPMLDLPPVDDSVAAFEVLGCGGLEYSDIFAGFGFADFAASYDELFRRSDGSEDSSDEAWTPVGTESPSGGSDPYASSGRNQYFLNGDFQETLEDKVDKVFDLSYDNANLGTAEDSEMSHEAKLSSACGYTYVFEGSTMRKEDEKRYSSGVADDIILCEDSSGNISVETPWKMTSSKSHNCVVEESHEYDEKAGEAHGIGLSPNFASLNGVGLRGEPSNLSSASGLPPTIVERKKIPASGSPPTKSNTTETVFGGGLFDFFDVEMNADAGSSSMASAEAIKEAMDNAKLKINSAKELMKRRKDGVNNELNTDGKVRMVFDESVSRDDELHSAHEREFDAVKISGDNMQFVSKASWVLPDPLQPEDAVRRVPEPFQSQSSSLDPGLAEGEGEWKVTEDCYELVNNGNSETESSVPDSIKKPGQEMNSCQLGNSNEKTTHAQKLEQNVEKIDPPMKDDKDSESADEACNPRENRRRLRASKPASRNAFHQKMVKLAQDVHETIIGGHVETVQKGKEGLEGDGVTWQNNERKFDQAALHKEESYFAGSEISSEEDFVQSDCNDEGKEDHSLKENERREAESTVREETLKRVEELTEREDNSRGVGDAHKIEQKEEACALTQVEAMAKMLSSRDDNLSGLNEALEKKDSDVGSNKAHEESNVRGHEIYEKEVQQTHQCEENAAMLKCNGKKLKESVGPENFEKHDVASENISEKSINAAADHPTMRRRSESSNGICKIVDEVDNCEMEEPLQTSEAEKSQKIHESSAINEEQKVESEGDLQPEIKITDQDSSQERNLHIESEVFGSSMLNEVESVMACEYEERESSKLSSSPADEESGENHENHAAEDMPISEEKGDFRSGTLHGQMESKVADMTGQPILSERNESAQKQYLASNINRSVGKEAKDANRNLAAEDRGMDEKLKREEESERESLREPQLEKERERERELEKERLRKMEAERLKERENELEKLRVRRVKELREREKEKELEKERLRKLEEERQREREKDLEKERLRKLEEEWEREREREKDRMGVELKMSADRERAAVERATAEARQRAMAEARERLEKACAEAREKNSLGKASKESQLRAERAAVERATAEARERALEKARAERGVERSVSEKFSSSFRNVELRHCQSSNDLWTPDKSDGVQGESAQRCRARLERHRRTVERVAKALAEKNMRDLVVQREQAERNRFAETLDADIKRWSNGKEGNLRALLSTLQYILGSESGWQPIPLTEVITSAAVKKAYRKATLCVHPDKLQQRGATIQQKYICEKVFDLLKDAWNRFNSEER